MTDLLETTTTRTSAERTTADAAGTRGTAALRTTLRPALPGVVLGDVLQGVLDDVRIAPDASRATVLDREVEATGPREMKRLLAGALYERVHAGARVRELPPRLRDPDLEARLAAVVPVRTLRVRVPLLSPAQPVPGSEGRRVLVGLAGLRVWVPAGSVEAHDRDRAWEPGARADVVVPAVRPAVSPGFLFVDRSTVEASGVQRVYVNVAEPERAPEVWGRVLEHLEGAGLSFRAKVLSAKDLYPRRDAVVVYLSSRDASAARGLADEVAGLDGVGTEVSRFAHRLAPGVATAAEPRDHRRGMQGLSFGEHRATVIATALVESAASPHERPARVLAALVEAGVDPADLARNSPSGSS